MEIIIRMTAKEAADFIRELQSLPPEEKEVLAERAAERLTEVLASTI